ncbi:MAG: acyl carrier protein [Planctomycetes bacterium]|jgi:acyl carrier protein|nr:acyl carrier protein [Planctomycetota bacterium]
MCQAREDRFAVTPQEIEEKVIAIVSEQMSVDKSEIRRETSFVNDLNADSLDTVELVMELEDEFDMNIPDDEAEKLQTVGQSIDFISKQLTEKAAN